MVASSRFAAIPALVAIAAGPVLAQCQPQWIPGPGPGLNGSVFALLTLDNGDLMAGGAFSMAGSTIVYRIGRWDGTAWSNVSYLSPYALALTTLESGDLIVGTQAFGACQRWNGAAWSYVGIGNWGGSPNGGTVLALTRMPNGDLVAAGDFGVAGATPANSVARWNGTTWSRLGTSVYPAYHYALAVLPNGDLIVGGVFQIGFGPIRNIARWDGTTWFALGAGVDLDVYALLALPNGDVIVGGRFTTAGGAPASCIARWDGSQWHPLGAGVSLGVTCLGMFPNGDLAVGGGFSSAGGVPANHVARWNGTTWSALGDGLNDYPRAFATLPNGDVVVGGDFTMAGGLPAAHIARWAVPDPLFITSQPTSVTICPRRTATFTVANAGTGAAYRWEWRHAGAWVGVLPGGNVIPGTGLVAFRASGPSTPTLGVDVADFTISGDQFRCAMSNSCGTITSDAAALTICYANYDCATDIPILSVADFLYYMNSFAAGDSAANCDSSTTPPALNVQDFTCFLNKFAAGCS